MASQAPPRTGPDVVADWLTFALARQAGDDRETDMARRIAATLIIASMEDAGADPQAIESIRDKFRQVHPGIFPPDRTH